MSDDGKLRVVLLLGAGASTCFQCPTLGTFCDRLNEMGLAIPETPENHRIKGWIRDFWDLRHQCMLAASIGRGFDPDNYEDVLSVANEWAEWGPEVKDEIRSKYESAIRAIEFVLYDPEKFNAVFSLTDTSQQLVFRNLLSDRIPILARDDRGKLTLVTFNIDFRLERELLEKNFEIDYNFAIVKVRENGYVHQMNGDSAINLKAIRILKLHGSLNWQKKGKGKNIDFEPIIQGIIQPDRVGLIFSNDRQIFWHPEYEPFIVEPTLRKVIETQKLKEIWKSAYESISNAHYIIVCGYSFPQTDLHAVSFLRSSISQNKQLRRIYAFDTDYPGLYKRLTNHFEKNFVNRIFRAFKHPEGDKRPPSFNGIRGLATMLGATEIRENYPSGTLQQLIRKIDKECKLEYFISPHST